LKLNTRGFSLIEIVSAVTLISILSVFSVTQYNRSKTKSLTKEAQLQLGHLHRMQAIYHSEHDTFTFELSGNMFPKGILLYNVGFGHRVPDFKVNPCDPGEHNSKNNYYELCGDDMGTSDKRSECGFKNKKGNVPELGRPYKDLSSSIYYKPNQSCSNNTIPEYSEVHHECQYNPGTLTQEQLEKLRKEIALEEIEDKAYRKYIAYAVGDILYPRDFSTTDYNELDVWRINGNGFLEHCNDPLDSSTSNTCLKSSFPSMRKTKNDSSQYCD